MSVRLMASYDFSLVLEPEGSAEGSDGAPSQQPLVLHSSLRKKLRSLLSSKTVVDFSHTPASGGGGETLQVCQWVCPCAPVLLLAESSPFTPLLSPTPSPPLPYPLPSSPFTPLLSLHSPPFPSLPSSPLPPPLSPPLLASAITQDQTTSEGWMRRTLSSRCPCSRPRTCATTSASR